MTCVLTICHVKLPQSTAVMEQKHFHLRLLSPALSNLWLSPVIKISILLSSHSSFNSQKLMMSCEMFIFLMASLAMTFQKVM